MQGSSRRDSDAAENTEQREEEGEVEPVDRGLNGVDGGGGQRGELVWKARLTANEYEIGGEPELRVLNLGEGWRSIAKAVLKYYPTA